MEALLSSSVAVPIYQIILVLGLGAIFLLYDRVRLALCVIYFFILSWAKPWNLDLFTDTTPARLNGPEALVMAICGITVLLAMVSFAYHRD